MTPYEPLRHPQDVADINALADAMAQNNARTDRQALERAARCARISYPRAKYIWNLILTDLGEQAT